VFFQTELDEWRTRGKKKAVEIDGLARACQTVIQEQTSWPVNKRVWLSAILTVLESGQNPRNPSPLSQATLVDLLFEFLPAFPIADHATDMLRVSDMIDQSFQKLPAGDGLMTAWKASLPDVLEMKMSAFITHEGALSRLARRLEGERTPAEMALRQAGQTRLKELTGQAVGMGSNFNR